MLPFSNIEFFVGGFFFSLTGYLLALLLRWPYAMKTAAGLFCLWYFAYEFTGGLYVLLMFFGALYVLLWLVLTQYKNLPGLLVCFVLLFPMVGLKVSKDLSFFGFTGISFVTFRAIQFYLDFDHIKKFPNPFDFFVFLFFPSWLMIGPLDTYQNFKREWDNSAANVRSNYIIEGLDDMVLGLAQKLVMARAVNDFWMEPLLAMEPGMGMYYLQAMGYLFYLYFDFAGYSNMAAGLSRFFGIRVPYNFNMPLLARNPQDFWKRFHASLTEWLGNYLFRPFYKWLNGKKQLKSWPLFKQNLCVFVTFMMMGCWNGFTINFVLSGCLFGLYSVVYNTYIYQCRKKGRDIVFGTMNPQLVKVISIVIMIHLSAFAVYVFSGLIFSHT